MWIVVFGETCCLLLSNKEQYLYIQLYVNYKMDLVKYKVNKKYMFVIQCLCSSFQTCALL